jgi:hypothetical protein
MTDMTSTPVAVRNNVSSEWNCPAFRNKAGCHALDESSMRDPDDRWSQDGPVRLGNTSTLIDPAVVDDFVSNRQNRKR